MSDRLSVHVKSIGVNTIPSLFLDHLSGYFQIDLVSVPCSKSAYKTHNVEPRLSGTMDSDTLQRLPDLIHGMAKDNLPLSG